MAFFAVVIGTVAVVASAITLPLIYNYVQSLQSHLIAEVEYCKSRSRDMWVQVFNLNDGVKGQTINSGQLLASRSKREWLFGQWVGGQPNLHSQAVSSAPIGCNNRCR